VIGTLAVALSVKPTLEQAVALASQNAAIAVEKLGTASVTAEELSARWTN
jgi:bifunctional ADP-heptose synthase (sugar kinase/adenylyltransferase)